VAVFQWGWLADLLGVASTGPIVSFLPILLIGLLFGLAMDYEVFLVSRMREEHVHGAEPREAVIGGFRHGARVVTAAALIMASVFAGFVLGPDATIKSIGFALAFGVLVDAFVVRMALVPAVMTLLGRSAWYLPRWLDRGLPNVDIEGSTLERHTPAPDRELADARR
jgi:putative drug exporter of the RND superfamily